MWMHRKPRKRFKTEEITPKLREAVECVPETGLIREFAEQDLAVGDAAKADEASYRQISWRKTESGSVFLEGSVDEKWSLVDSQEIVDAWQDDHNSWRPQSALGNKSPHEFLATLNLSSCSAEEDCPSSINRARAKADVTARRKGYRKVLKYGFLNSQNEPENQSMSQSKQEIRFGQHFYGTEIGKIPAAKWIFSPHRRIEKKSKKCKVSR